MGSPLGVVRPPVVLGVVAGVALSVLLVVNVVVDEEVKAAPALDFSVDQSEGDPRVVAVRSTEPLLWGDLQVTGCNAPAGVVSAGDTLTACQGDVRIVHLASGAVVAQFDAN